ncbi:methyltransferase domain-containing protein [Methanoplanus sp. FWC-SCC4]|uniref:Methyltransferase domain-containing protein n=1 Tax=Methanochimaera problematica TaxID=2609417 RepID=A0AA97I3W2_9EURY|nr:methyltransferase domain-containing protein [Methanoplanus sp. FWC-SCC4]WOF17113.1 methyltransferase domain-containing protein [Methanoplanus sp. FWC-SCC4]
MDFRDLVSISQGELSIMNPCSIEKALYMGEISGLSDGSKVIDFGCGNGTVLALWGENFGTSGVGIEMREDACQTASATIEELGLSEKISIFFADASEYEKEKDEYYDVALSLGSSQIWGGFEGTLNALSGFITGKGSIIIGERYWKKDGVAPEFCRQWSEILTEYEILQIIRDSGFDLKSVVRADENDWDIYESGIWRNCIEWLLDENNQKSQDYDEVLSYYRRVQEEYIAYGREYVGWAMYLITPSF